MSEIKTNIGSGLNGDYRKDLNGNFIIIKANEGDLKKDVTTLKNDIDTLKKDHKTILEKLEGVKKLEKANADRLDQQHLNMEQLVTILHDNFEVPAVWNGNDIVLEREV
ncbi:hypothetical protein [Pediococcus pentosaceus]|uniref:hypothetical protein n=1 Tax=Pediococcus pentosaceus TaxID=1255 RepID=UPI001C7D1A57|nr:hypothetical protein [Pediococcus pentosaceus]QYY85596.1 hypothetical protein GRI00_03125 [Pediococcus pentosaceus]